MKIVIYLKKFWLQCDKQEHSFLTEFSTKLGSWENFSIRQDNNAGCFLAILDIRSRQPFPQDPEVKSFTKPMLISSETTVVMNERDTSQSLAMAMLAKVVSKNMTSVSSKPLSVSSNELRKSLVLNFCSICREKSFCCVFHIAVKVVSSTKWYSANEYLGKVGKSRSV